MNDIYEQKAKKYKYKYLKLKRLKREIEYIGGWYPGKGIVDGITNSITNLFTSNADKAKADAEAKAVKGITEGIEKVKADASESEEADTEYEDFKKKIINLKEAIENKIKPIYNIKIFGNINEKIFKDNNKVEFEGNSYDIVTHREQILTLAKEENGPNLLKCYKSESDICDDCLKNNKNNEKKCIGCFVNRNHGKMITKPNLEQLLGKCNINNSHVQFLLDDTKKNDKALNPNQKFNYDNNYLHHMNNIYNVIITDIVKNYDLYSLCDIINNLYTKLSEKIKIKYTPLFNDNKYLVYTVDDLINRLDQIIKI
jgi:hypothetical protein